MSINHAGRPSVICYDVGARGNLQPVWHALAETDHAGSTFVLFEPDANAAARLRSTYAAFGHVTIVEEALGSAAGEFPFHITAHATCSSLLEPDQAALQSYLIAPIFDVRRVVPVEVDRLDAVVSRRNLPPPDFCKIDVQGAEMLILEGMGELLAGCSCLELETHIYPLYKGQALLGDIVSFLARFGLYLCRLDPQRHFEAEFVEANSIFCKRARDLPSDAARDKLAFIQELLGVKTYPQARQIAGLA